MSANISNINPGLYLREIVPESIFNDSERFILFLKAYYEWMNTSTLTLKNISGAFSQNEEIIGLTSKAKAKLNQVNSANLVAVISSGYPPFEKFEQIQGQTSGAIATLFSVKDNVLRLSNKFVDYRDLRNSVDEFAANLKDELYYNFPTTSFGNKRLVSRKLKDFYESKGQEESYKFLMKFLYNQDIEISYPGDDILIVSDGKYAKDLVIKTSVVASGGANNIFEFQSKTIRGEDSGAVADVIEIKRYYVQGIEIAEMILEFVSGVFLPYEKIYDVENPGGPNGLYTTVYGLVSGYNVNFGGSGYTTGTFLPVVGDGVEAKVKVSDIYRSGIDKIKVVANGHGYQLGTVALVDNTGSGGSNLAIKVTGISNTYTVTSGNTTYTLGEVTRVDITNKGTDYFKEPAIALKDNTIVNLGLLSDKLITIQNSGNTYSVNDAISFVGGYGGGVGAAANVASVDLGLQPRTNYFLNSSMSGANSVSNTYPTNWTIFNGNGVSSQIVSRGTENGLPYIDLKVQGTATSDITTGNILVAPLTANTSANAGQDWTSSYYIRLSSGSLANVTSLTHRLSERNSANTILVQTTQSILSDIKRYTRQRFPLTRTLTDANTRNLTSELRFGVSNTSTVNFTLRISAPQLEQNYFVTDFIPTTNAAVTIPGYGEPTRINYIRNSMCVGANTASNTLPTNWGIYQTMAGVTKTVVGTGVEDGIAYLDYRINGTVTTGTAFLIIPESLMTSYVANNQTWAFSSYVKVAAGSTSNTTSFTLGMDEKTSVGTYIRLAGTTTYTPNTASLGSQRRTLVATTAGGSTVGALTPYIAMNAPIGAVVDVTLRIGMPQLELGNTVTSAIPTYNAVARRPSNEPTNDYNVYLEDGSKLLDETSDFLKYNTSNTSIAEWMGVGRISRVKMSSFGSGYRANDAPSVVVSSFTGSSANLIVTDVQGNNAIVVVDTANNTGGIGAIKTLDIVDFGVDYTQANTTINASLTGNQNANITPIITGLGQTVGQLTNDDGKISYKRIQDSYYYQKFSYLIKSGIEINRYKDVLKNILHPAGLEVFGVISIINEIDARMVSSDVTTVDSISNFILSFIESFANVQAEKLDDISDTLQTLANTAIAALTNQFIFDYETDTFMAQYGQFFYEQYQKNIPIPGTANFYTSNNTLVGTGTSFLSYFAEGSFVVLNQMHKLLVVGNIANGTLTDTSMLLNTSTGSNLSNQTVYRITTLRR